MALETVALVLIACDGFGLLVCSKLPIREEPVEFPVDFSVYLRQHGFEEPVRIAKSNQQIVTLHGAVSAVVPYDDACGIVVWQAE